MKNSGGLAGCPALFFGDHWGCRPRLKNIKINTRIISTNKTKHCYTKQ